MFRLFCNFPTQIGSFLVYQTLPAFHLFQYEPVWGWDKWCGIEIRRLVNSQDVVETGVSLNCYCFVDLRQWWPVPRRRLLDPGFVQHPSPSVRLSPIRTHRRMSLWHCGTEVSSQMLLWSSKIHIVINVCRRNGTMIACEIDVLKTGCFELLHENKLFPEANFRTSIKNDEKCMEFLEKDLKNQWNCWC